MLEGSNPQGLLAVLERHGPELRRFLLAHGAGDAVEDLLQELRMKLLASPAGPVQSSLGYLYRAATNLMIDQRRSRAQAGQRDRAWAELLDRSAESVDQEPSPERRLDAAQRAALVQKRLAALPERARSILLRHRVDGISQRMIASEYGVSQSTVESDLRTAYRLLDRLRDELHEENPQ